MFFDIVVSFFGFILFCVIAWQSGEQSVILFNSKLTSGVLQIPVFPFPALVAFGLALLAVAVLASFVESVSKAVTAKWN
jgi:TRAP-type C4-dicarboxylate transport system permease small subunit